MPLQVVVSDHIPFETSVDSVVHQQQAVRLRPVSRLVCPDGVDSEVWFEALSAWWSRSSEVSDFVNSSSHDSVNVQIKWDNFQALITRMLFAVLEDFSCDHSVAGATPCRSKIL